MRIGFVRVWVPWERSPGVAIVFRRPARITHEGLRALQIVAGEFGLVRKLWKVELVVEELG